VPLSRTLGLESKEIYIQRSDINNSMVEEAGCLQAPERTQNRELYYRSYILSGYSVWERAKGVVFLAYRWHCLFSRSSLAES
jgi:hypothetical protein